MHEETLPQFVDLRRLGDDGASLTGSMPLAGRERLAGSLVESTGTASADIRVSREPGGLVIAEGQVDAGLALQCQRCLGTVTVPVHADFRVVVVATEADTEGHDEAVVALDERLDVFALLEDELILELPVVALHDADSGCADSKQHFGPPGEPEPERENPFAVLAELKRRDDH